LTCGASPPVIAIAIMIKIKPGTNAQAMKIPTRHAMWMFDQRKKFSSVFSFLVIRKLN